MLSNEKNTGKKSSTPKINSGNAKLLALILKKGKRSTAAFKKAFGMDPDFPQVNTIRKTAWK